MTVFGHVCGSICEVKQGPARETLGQKSACTHILFVSKVSIVTGIRRVAVAIPVTVIVFGSHVLLACKKMWKVSTVTRIRWVALAILVIVIVVGLSYLFGVQKVSTVTRMSVPPEK